MGTNTTSVLAESWALRAQAARADLIHAAKAPTLFKPEFVEERRADLAKAASEFRRWTA